MLHCYLQQAELSLGFVLLFLVSRCFLTCQISMPGFLLQEFVVLAEGGIDVHVDPINSRNTLAGAAQLRT